MAIVRIISRSILRESPQHSSLRWLCTVAEKLAPPQRNSRDTLLDAVVEAGPKSSIVDVLNKWVGEGKPVNRFDIRNLNRHFRSHKNDQARIQLYEWMDGSNLELHSSDHAERISLLWKVDGIASAEKYFDSIQEKTGKVYGTLLSCYHRGRDLNKALEIFEKLKELNDTSTQNYNAVLSLYNNLNQPEKVLTLTQEMEEKNITLNVFTYNMMINSHAALKNLDACEGVLEKMERTGVKPDLFTYGDLATIYSKSGLHEKALIFLQLMEKMASQGNGARSSISFHTRLRVYSSMNDLSGIIRAWEDRKSVDAKPSNTIYLMMISSLLGMGNKDVLERIIKEWEDGCSTYDHILTTVVFDHYLSRNMIERANALCRRMKETESTPSLSSLDLFATISLKNSEIDLALEYLEMGLSKAKSKESGRFPRTMTIYAFISYFKEKGDTDRGRKFVESMKKHGRMIPDSLNSYIEYIEHTY